MTEIKGIEPAKVMYAESAYALFGLVLQIPATILIEKLGSRKALVLGNLLVTIQISMMIFANHFIVLLVAYMILALRNFYERCFRMYYFV